MIRVIPLLAVVVLLSACASNPSPPASGPSHPTATRAAAAYVAPTPDVQPVRFPEDEAPHDMLTEWWYYTGHLFAEDGRRFGFELVFFQGMRGQFPPYYAAHFAVTDNAANRFQYAERFGPGAAQRADQGFDLRLDTWRVAGALGEDEVTADMESYAVDLQLSATRPPVLHGGTGYVDFGPSGGSYYYSRTRMHAEGTLVAGEETLAITGEVWFDHQWGNFIAVGAGGWDWFSTHLDNGDDLTISLVHDVNRALVMSYGTLVRADGTVIDLAAEDIDVRSTDTWTSPRTGATYPARWAIDLPNHDLTIEVVPTMPDQELNTVASTGVIYWEGEVEVRGTSGGVPITGLGYVELTGYAPAPPP